MLVVRVLQHLYLTKRNSIECFYVVCGVMVRPTCDVLYQLQGGVWEVVGNKATNLWVNNSYHLPVGAWHGLTMS